MKYGEAVVMMQDSLPSWVFGAGDYLVAGFLLLLAIVLFSSLSALMFGTPSFRQMLVRKPEVHQAVNGGESDQSS